MVPIGVREGVRRKRRWVAVASILRRSSCQYSHSFKNIVRYNGILLVYLELRGEALFCDENVETDAIALLAKIGLFFWIVGDGDYLVRRLNRSVGRVHGKETMEFELIVEWPDKIEVGR
jgi:hypothetical protein